MASTASAQARSLRLALAQLRVGADARANVAAAVKAITNAAKQGAQIVALPECFNSPYGTQYFDEYAEPVPGPSTLALSDAARENKVYVVGGSVPERDGDRLYNTCAVFDPEGQLIAKHRKVHLFDIDVPGKIRFCESETLSAGSSMTMFNTPYCKIGIGICYDIRFPELAQIYAANDCDLLIYPGAFNMTTGPAHWELLQRARALDGQLFVAGVSPARDESASYTAWGHTTICDPWGQVVASAGHEEEMIITDLDLGRVEEVRKSIPTRQQKRSDLYNSVQPTDLFSKPLV